MCVYIYIYILCVHIYIYIYICIYTHTYIDTHTCVHVYVTGTEVPAWQAAAEGLHAGRRPSGISSIIILTAITITVTITSIDYY